MKAAILFLSSLSPLLAELPFPNMSSDLSSDQATYDGDVLRLEGHVFLDHDLGQMEAETALLKKGEPSLEFSTIHLKDQVSLFFEDRGKLFSEQAFLDLQTLKGSLTRGKYPVVFHGNDIELFCSAIDLTFSRKEMSLALDSLLAKEDVHIEYNEVYHLDCDEAFYQENSLIAKAKSPQVPCHLTHLGDVIDALKVTFDLETDLLTLEFPKGEISSLFFPGHEDKKCQFASNLLTWHPKEELLTMQGAIAIHDPSIGTLIGDNLFSLKQSTQLGKKVIQTIETEGKTLLVDGSGQTLTSYGTLKLDRENLRMSCTSTEDQQLIYENQELRLYADTASIEYALEQMELKPHIVYLHGNVKIFSHAVNRPLRKGLADHIIYDPMTRETRLLADPGHHVLFWDDQKKLTLSSPEILISIDPDSGEETIKGVGTVRFTFTEEEGKRFERFLPHDFKS
ncbi:MAG: hypothetical protein KDK64_00375 [Chlamydiia bacterium]|nr:hypothetical protein [Chlamydiia bacterium]